MKQLRVLLLSPPPPPFLDRMLVHRRVTPSSMSPVRLLLPILYTWVERDNVGQKFLSKETTRWQGLGVEPPTFRSEVQRADHYTTAPPQCQSCTSMFDSLISIRIKTENQVMHVTRLKKPKARLELQAPRPSKAVGYLCSKLCAGCRSCILIGKFKDGGS